MIFLFFILFSCTHALCAQTLFIPKSARSIDQYAAAWPYIHQQHLLHSYPLPEKKVTKKRNWQKIANTGINIGILCLTCYKLIGLYRNTFADTNGSYTYTVFGRISIPIPRLVVDSANNVSFLQQVGVLLCKMFITKLILKGILLCAFFL